MRRTCGASASVTHTIEGVAPRAEPGTAMGPRPEFSAGQGHHHGPLGDDGIAWIALPLSRRVSRRRSSSRSRRPSGDDPRERGGSGTEIIEELGEEHAGPAGPSSTRAVTACSRSRATTKWSAPSALRVVPGRAATSERAHSRGSGHRPAVRGDGRGVRPEPGTPRFPLPPPQPTVLDVCRLPTCACTPGKIQDIFSGQGITEARYSRSDDDGVNLTLEYLERPGPAFVFTNLVDSDSKFGHRNDPIGYAAAIEAF